MEYISIPQTVQAMQFDGTMAGAYDVLAWVYRNQGTGVVVKDNVGNGSPQIGANETPVQGNEWVVMIPDEGFVIMSNAEFTSTYTRNTG